MAAVFTVIVTLLGLYLLAQALWLSILLRYPAPEYAEEVHTFTTIDRWRIQLRRLKPAGGGGEPVLLVHSAAANHLNFMIPRGRSIADSLAGAGYDCWLVDLRGSRNSVPPRGANRKSPEFEEYLDFDIPAAIEYIRRQTGYEEVHWVGHSMGAIILHCYALKSALRQEPDGIRCAATLGGPPGFRFPHPSIAWVLPLVRLFHSQIEAATRMLLPLLRRYHIGLYGFPLNWANVDTRVSSAELVHVFQYTPPKVLATLEHWAATGQWSIMGGSFNIDDNIDAFEVPLLAIYGSLDPFAKPGDGREFLDRMPMEDKRMLIAGKEHGCANDYNHVDLAFGRNGPEEIHEPIIAWLREHPIEADAGETAPAPETQAATTDAVAQEAPAKPKTAKKKAAKKKSAAKSKSASSARKPASAKSGAKKKPPSKKKAAAKKQSAAKSQGTSEASSRSSKAKTPQQQETSSGDSPAPKKAAPAKKKPPVRRRSAAKKKPSAESKPSAEASAAPTDQPGQPDEDTGAAVRGSLSALPPSVLQSLRTAGKTKGEDQPNGKGSG